jgi:hypothetical protein
VSYWLIPYGIVLGGLALAFALAFVVSLAIASLIDGWRERRDEARRLGL